MAAFPETPTPSVPFDMAAYMKTLRAAANDGSETVRKGWAYPLYSWTIRYNPVHSWATLKPIHDFYLARSGSYERFTFFDPRGADSSPIGYAWTTVYFGTAPSGTTAVDLPFKNGTSITVFQNGSSKAGTVTAGIGTDGRDSFVPTTSWTLGALLTVTFTGQRAFYARFADDNLPATTGLMLLTGMGLSMREVR